MIDNLNDIIIVGAGAAGMTAALYSLRAGKKVTILEHESIGGQIATSPKVENFPTIQEISGMELADRLYNQIDALGVNFEFENVLKIEEYYDEKQKLFKVIGEYNNYFSKAVILATGVKHRNINVKGEEELVGKGVSYCAVCDGAFYKNEDVCLIGDGNTALQYSILLSNYCNKVYVNTLFDKFFGETKLVETLKSKPNVSISHNLALKEFIYNEQLEALIFEDTKTKELKTFNVKACFIAIGQIPNNQMFSNICELNKQGYIITNSDLETKTKGIYAIGDCREKKIRQLTTAVNDGTIAAINACSYIDSL